MQIKNNFRKFISRYSKIFYICYVLLFIEFISASGLVFLVATTKIISPDPQKRKAILFNKANTILAQGSALADLTMCDRFEDGDVTSLFKTGDNVIVDPINGFVELI